MPQVRSHTLGRTLCASVVCALLSASAVRTSNDPAAVVRDHLKLPMRFESGAGRTSPQIDFVARGAGYAVYLSSTGVALRLGRSTLPAASAPATISMRLVGSDPDARAIPGRELSGRTNHLHGSDQRKWLIGVRGYERVEYRGVYPGIDVVYYGNQRQLEYDFVIAPGASYRKIALAFEGQSDLSIDHQGALVIATAHGDVVQHPPVIYQLDADGARQAIDGGYTLDGSGRVAFRVGSYDPARPLVIDPVLGYATYLGGSGSEEAASLAVDAAGNVYLTGRTGSLDFPLQNPSQPGHGGPFYDAYVLKLTPSGDALVYATYLGGNDNDYGADIHVDNDGNVFVAGTTYSRNFPTLRPLQPALAGNSDMFLTRLDPSGLLTYSTYFGATDQEVATGLTVDALGRAYISGWTASPDLPTRNPIQARLAGSPAFKTIDGGTSWLGIRAGLNTTYVQKIVIDPQNTSTLYAGTYATGVFKSTDAGASWTAINEGLDDRYVYTLTLYANVLYAGTETGLFLSEDAGASWQRVYNLNGRVVSLAVDPMAPSTLYAALQSGMTGVYKSTDGGETWNDTGFHDQPNGIVLCSSSSSTLYVAAMSGVYKSTTGGSDWMWIDQEFMLGNTYAVAVDPNDDSLVYAASDGGLFRSTSGGAEWTLVGDFGVVISVALAPSDPSMLYVGTGFGLAMSRDRGDNWEPGGLNDVVAWTLAIDPGAPATVYVGSTTSIDAVLARFSADGATLEFSTYFGGSSFEEIADVHVDISGNVYLVGSTASADLPVVNPLQPQFGGVRDVFVAKLSQAWEIEFATYLGDAGWESATTLAVDPSGSVVVAGETFSRAFPRMNAYQEQFGGGFVDGFVAKLTPDGGSFVFSTLLGGSGSEQGVTVALSPSGDIVVSGTTGSPNFPTLDPVQAAYGGGFIDMFVSRFSGDGALEFSTFLGGNDSDNNRRVAVTADERIWVMGDTHSTNFPTRDPLQAVTNGVSDIALARIDPTAPDTMAPVITIASPQSRLYVHTEVLAIEFSAADSESGLAADPVARLDERGVASGQTVSLLTLALGTHVLTASAQDVAGNHATKSVTFEIVATIDSLISAVELFSTAGAIDANTAGSLLAKARDAQEALARGNVNAAENKLQDFINHVAVRTGRGITTEAAQILTADARYVLGTT